MMKRLWSVLKRLCPEFKRAFLKLTELYLFVNKLEALDLRPIACQLVYPASGERWTLEQTRRAIKRYKRFLLWHYLDPNRAMNPSQEVDLVWHCHILDTKKYLEDCNWLFGYVLHHFPYGKAL